MPKISLVIPVHNSDQYIEQCLDSALTQTLDDIEIICVDDASEDKSREILKRYEASNDNIQCIYYDKTCSASQARKDAVLKSTGDFIMFLDSDDFLEPNACQIAYKSITKKKTDIVQFDTIIENCANLSRTRIRKNQKYLKPYTEDLITGNLRTECFINKKFSFTLWNKIYVSEICRRAFAEVEDGLYPKANDLYAAYYILKEAKSYSGINEKLYHYCFGRGMTGHDQMSMHDFELCCASTRVYKAIKNHAESSRLPVHPSNESENEKNQAESNAFQIAENKSDRVIYAEEAAVIENIRQRFHTEQLSKWYDNVPDYDKREALSLYYKAWDEDPFEVVCAFSRMSPYCKTMISKYIDVMLQPRVKRHKIRNIAMYYRNIINGGAQRVVAFLASFFADMDSGARFNVVLLTDSEPTDEDYDLSPRITRIVLPRYEEGQKNFADRGKALLEVIEKYDIDAFIHSMWNDPGFLWDMLCIITSRKKPAFFAHMHSYFGLPWKNKFNQIEEMYNSYSYVDGLITLSDYDRNFWKYSNNNIYTILNPCMEKKNHPRNRWHEQSATILWAGRISTEKQPLDVVRIMKYVVEKVPDAVCRFLGEGENPPLKNSLVSMIKESGLDNNIILEGFHKDVEQFYEDADVFLSTSSFEGFQLTLYESASYGIPTVTYNIPWLEYHKCFDGCEVVEQNDAKNAADVIVKLLQNQQEWDIRSKKLYSSYENYKNYDFGSKWLNVFDNFENNITPEEISDWSQGIIYRQVMRSHGEVLAKYYIENQRNVRQMGNTIQDLNKELTAVRTELDGVYNSTSWKLGNAVFSRFHWIKVLKEKIKNKQ